MQATALRYKSYAVVPRHESLAMCRKSLFANRSVELPSLPIDAIFEMFYLGRTMSDLLEQRIPRWPESGWFVRGRLERHARLLAGH